MSKSNMESTKINALSVKHKKFSLDFEPLKPILSKWNGNEYYKTFDLNISGFFDSEIAQPTWNVDAKDICDKVCHGKYKRQRAVDLSFLSGHRRNPNIDLALRTNLVIRAYPEIGLLDEMDSPFLPEDKSSTQNNYDLAILKSEEINYIFNSETACLGAGIQMGKPNPTNPYPGLFLGIRLFYDEENNKFLHVDTDCNGCADWYQSPYQVIIYPGKPMQCPPLTVAVSIWSTCMFESNIELQDEAYCLFN